MKFRKLGIDESILKAIEKENFEDPTEIQEKCIPAVLEGKDIIAGSATGSGKTLAFGCGIIQVKGIIRGGMDTVIYVHINPRREESPLAYCLKRWIWYDQRIYDYDQQYCYKNTESNYKLAGAQDLSQSIFHNSISPQSSDWAALTRGSIKPYRIGLHAQSKSTHRGSQRPLTLKPEALELARTTPG